jgi:hypothetical protein
LRTTKFKLATRLSDQEAVAMEGKMARDQDYDVLLTGPTRIIRPGLGNDPLAVFLPGAVADEMTAAYPLLTKIRVATNNRGMASGVERVQVSQSGSVAKPVYSSILGAFDPQGGRFPYCRLTAYTAQQTTEWHELRPLFKAIARHFEAEVPDRFAAQAKEAARTDPDWVIPGTPFTTITVNNCVDPATECLTKRAGWTTYDQLRSDDELLAYDPDTHTTRWEQLTGVFVNDHYDGDMVELTGRGFSALTTPDHRWPMRNHKDAARVTLTRDLPTKSSWWRLLHSAPHEAPAEPTYSDEFVRLVAWYYTEGSLLKSGTSIGISQSERVNPEHCASISADLKALGATSLTEWRNRRCARAECRRPVVARELCTTHYNEQRYSERQTGLVREPYARTRSGRSRRKGLVVNDYERADGLRFWVLTGDRVDEFLAVAPGKDKVPTMAFLSALTADQMRMFVDVSVAADGHCGNRFTQEHPGRMDAFTTAAVLAGHNPSVNEGGWHCTLRTTHRTVPQHLQRRYHHYEGTIWCPSIPSSHWVARRNGTVYISGNSYPTGIHTDKGDLDAGFSTLAVARRGDFTGGRLVFPKYRIGVDLQDGDLILMNAHELHGNTAITCRCGKVLDRPCDVCGAERISVVSYFRSRLVSCGSMSEEEARRLDRAEAGNLGLAKAEVAP